MPKITELGEQQLQEIAVTVRKSLNAKYGAGRVHNWINSDPEITMTFVKDLWIGIRTVLELCDAEKGN